MYASYITSGTPKNDTAVGVLAILSFAGSIDRIAGHRLPGSELTRSPPTPEEFGQFCVLRRQADPCTFLSRQQYNIILRIVGLHFTLLSGALPVNALVVSITRSLVPKLPVAITSLPG